jgi:uncharacterized Ntn-hydrolase superfamily protein
MTYSVLGHDASNGDLGVAVQSKFPGVGSLVPYGEADVGVVATQGFGNPRHGSVGLMLLKSGATPQQALEVLRGDDSRRHERQFAQVDGRGRVAAYTGTDLHSWNGWSGSAAGHDCVALGNGLAGSAVVDRMITTFEDSRASLAERTHGYYRGELDDSWDASTQRQLELFLGSENYDNRIDNGGLFDLEVLADLRLRYGHQSTPQ